MEKETTKPAHSGHRGRMLEKLRTQELTEYEYMEILLFNVLPRRNTNDIARRILSHFGSVEGVFNASMDDLCEVEGVGESLAAYLRCIGEFYARYSQSGNKEFEGLYTFERFSAFMSKHYVHKQTETLEIYFLDENGYIQHKEKYAGDVDSVYFTPEQLAVLVARYQSAGVVFIHNHPGNSIEPSALDIEMTKKCQFICSSNNVILCDHLICSGSGVFSFYKSGLLRDISKEFSIDRLFDTDITQENE